VHVGCRCVCDLWIVTVMCVACALQANVQAKIPGVSYVTTVLRIGPKMYWLAGRWSVFY
jgi:hypothetical protein